MKETPTNKQSVEKLEELQKEISDRMTKLDTVLHQKEPLQSVTTSSMAVIPNPVLETSLEHHESTPTFSHTPTVAKVRNVYPNRKESDEEKRLN